MKLARRGFLQGVGLALLGVTSRIYLGVELAPGETTYEKFKRIRTAKEQLYSRQHDMLFMDFLEEADPCLEIANENRRRPYPSF
jgi:hypothetical protein